MSSEKKGQHRNAPYKVTDFVEDVFKVLHYDSKFEIVPEDEQF